MHLFILTGIGRFVSESIRIAKTKVAMVPERRVGHPFK